MRDPSSAITGQNEETDAETCGMWNSAGRRMPSVAIVDAGASDLFHHESGTASLPIAALQDQARRSGLEAVALLQMQMSSVRSAVLGEREQVAGQST